MTQEALKLALDYLESRGLAWNVQIALREALREHAMREVQRLGQEIEQEPVMILPDGSAFGVMSFPLPDDHWLYAPNEYKDGEYEPIDLPKPILTHALRDAVVAAVRYAVRGATMRGQETDFDPDALVQNAVYALCGPYVTPPQRTEQPTPVQDCFVCDGKGFIGEGGYKCRRYQSKRRTSMTQEALKMALEALDNLLYWDNGKPEYDEAREAITAIKEALAQPELCKYGQEPKLCTSSPMDCQCAIDAALAQPEQETVGYWKEHAQGLQRDYDSLLADFQAQQEERNFCQRCGKRTKDIHTCTPPQPYE